MKRLIAAVVLTALVVLAVPSFGSASLSDTDGDGIENSIDLEPNSFSRAFSDAGVEGTEAPTWGEILSTSGYEMSITDLPAPRGVLVTVVEGAPEIGPSGPTLSACGEQYTVQLQRGESQTELECGSVIISVLQGQAQVIVGEITVTVAKGGDAEVNANEDGTAVTVTNLDNGGDLVTVSNDVVQQTVQGGTTLNASQMPDSINPPHSVSDCMEGSWTNYTDETGTVFKNQGDCVSYVATEGRNEAAG